MTARSVRRRSPPTIAEFCKHYGNEDSHTEHVTALALRLFDDTRDWLGWKPADRRLLEAAARLHDLGYAVNPCRHPEAGAELIRRRGLRGFRGSQWTEVAALALLHSGKLRAGSGELWLKKTRDPDRIRRLGALLRIADGLDFSHLQEATITTVRREADHIVVGVHTALFGGTLSQADRKSDLWRQMIPLGIRFEPAAADFVPVPALLEPAMPVTVAARRLITLQQKIISINVAGAIVGRDPEPVHDIRVAIRRLRLLLRIFRKHLPRGLTDDIDRRLQLLARGLGPARDLDVWIEFLESEPVRAAFAGNRRWRPFFDHQLAGRQLEQPTVRRHLRGRAFATLRQRLARLVRIELVHPPPPRKPLPLARLAANTVRKSSRRALKLEKLLRSDDPDDLHRLRISLRRARYAGEFFGPILGPPVSKLTKATHCVERPLGRIHDIDTGLQRIHEQGPVPPRLLVTQLAAERRQKLEQLHQAWKKLSNHKFQRRVQRHLRECTRAGSQ